MTDLSFLPLPAAARLPFTAPAGQDLAELHALYRCLPPPPWRVGERYWELLDSRGNVILRLETVNTRQAAGALARLWRALGTMLGYGADGKMKPPLGAPPQPTQ